MGTKKKRVSGSRTPEVELLAKAIVARWKASLAPLSVERVGAEFTEASRYDVVAALRALEHAGEGTFAPVRGGKKLQFVWKSSTSKHGDSKQSSVNRVRRSPASANALIPSGHHAGGDEPSGAVHEHGVQEHSVHEHSIHEHSGAVHEHNVLAHHFHLRSDFVVNVVLPSDLTVVEAERLCRFLQAIPFESNEEG